MTSQIDQHQLLERANGDWKSRAEIRDEVAELGKFPKEFDSFIEAYLDFKESRNEKPNSDEVSEALIQMLMLGDSYEELKTTVKSSEEDGEIKTEEEWFVVFEGRYPTFSREIMDMFPLVVEIIRFDNSRTPTRSEPEESAPRNEVRTETTSLKECKFKYEEAVRAYMVHYDSLPSHRREAHLWSAGLYSRVGTPNDCPYLRQVEECYNKWHEQREGKRMRTLAKQGLGQRMRRIRYWEAEQLRCLSMRMRYDTEYMAKDARDTIPKEIKRAKERYDSYEEIMDQFWPVAGTKEGRQFYVQECRTCKKIQLGRGNGEKRMATHRAKEHPYAR